MYDLRDPTYRPPGVVDENLPRRDCGLRDLDVQNSEASAIIRLMVDLAPKAMAEGLRGVPRLWIGKKAPHRTPFSGLQKTMSVADTVDHMVANKFIKEFEVRKGNGRPARFVMFPDDSLAPPVAGMALPCPFLAAEPGAVFNMAQGWRVHETKTLCMVRGLQYGRAYLCHQYPNGTIEVWRER